MHDLPDPVIYKEAATRQVPIGKRRKNKIPKHLGWEATKKEMDGFTKIVLKIPDDVPFDEAYYTHNLWIFFRKRVEKQKRTSSECFINS